MDAEKKKIAADCWKKGSEAMAKENWDYAIEMFGKSVSLVPDNLLYRQTLRGVERKKYADNGSGAKMAGLRLTKVRARIKAGRLKKNWGAIDRAAEDGLKINPWDSSLLFELGVAARERGFSEVATDAMRTAVANNSKNKDFARELAELLEARGDYNEAAKIWQRLAKLDPLDTHARTKSMQVLTDNVIDRGGYESAESTRDTMADDEIAKRLKTGGGGNADGPGQSEEADLVHAVRREPESIENRLRLGSHYRKNGKLEEAAATIQEALEISGGDPSIRESLEDVELDQLRKNLALAKDSASRDDDQDQDNVREINTELIRREIEIFSKRVDRYPNDLKLKYELGSRFVRVKNYVQAIPLFQVCVKDSRLATGALTSLGKCFIAEKKGKLAKRQFEKAAESVDQLDEPDLYKEVHYWLARLLEEDGDQSSAEHHYTEVLAVDYEYKDALSRMESLSED
jgi:tetratricopeptide (TPR) repeat protein